eukprot:GEMP01007330.1.p1 GENE.GEMP01007330.1~~GEMP01007330.1.p1  ORF type:complete len:564 (+),score=135.82 GEMP01007330.1:56-1747(+)
MICTAETSLAELIITLRRHAAQISTQSIGQLLSDDARSDAFFLEACGIMFDYTRQKATPETLDLLSTLANVTEVESKREGMFTGSKMNSTENRSVLHVALRAQEGESYLCDGHNVVPEVLSVRANIHTFADKVRSGKYVGFTNQTLTDVLCIGVGGSCLGTEFVYEALRSDVAATRGAQGRRIRFLANVDPVHVSMALGDLKPETTLVVVSSKTFTTAETMLNAKTIRKWLIDAMGDAACVGYHVVACSSDLEKTSEFGISAENVFPMWDWVGGRFSVLSSIGLLPLTIHFGSEVMNAVLDGAHDMDQHFRTAPLKENLPMLMGLLAVWNLSFLNYSAYALLPYSQSLNRFVAHVQQVEMESNGKRIGIDGKPCPISTGAMVFGEPGTIGQHSFYQLLHQGMAKVACEFIGFKESSNPVQLSGEPVSNHDELMSNFFAQPDALAFGKTEEQVIAEGVSPALVPHKVFPGDIPSICLLFEKCDAKNLGRLLALYEHRTAVQGWVWGINSFDQMGVELGKVLAKDVRNAIQAAREKGQTGASNGTSHGGKFCRATERLLNAYLKK